MNRGTELYLEVEDTCIAMLEALSRGDHSGQESGVQSEGGSGRKKPAITWEERLGLREGGKKARGGEAEREMEGGWGCGVGRGAAEAGRLQDPTATCGIWGLNMGSEGSPSLP